MRLMFATVASLLIATAVHADTMKNCAAAWRAMSAADKGKTSYKAWSTTCLKKDYKVQAAATPAAVPAGATAKCKDGSYSTSKTASGRCSSHGGVDKVL